MNENNTEVLVPKFKSGQFVHRIKNGDTVQIHGEPLLSKGAYWYGVAYRMPIREKNAMSSGGGASFSWKESDFEEVTNPIDLLIIAEWERKEEKDKLEQRMRVVDTELSKIRFSLNLVNPISKEVK